MSEPVSFSCAAEGVPSPVITWIKYGGGIFEENMNDDENIIEKVDLAIYLNRQGQVWIANLKHDERKLRCFLMRKKLDVHHVLHVLCPGEPHHLASDVLDRDT